MSSLIRTYNFIIEFFLFSLIILTPLVYGSVQILPLAVLESILFLILFIWFLKIASAREVSFLKPYGWIPICLFILVIFLQLIPLPKLFLSLLSPQRVVLINRFLPQESINQAFFSLSIYRNQTITKLIELLSYAGLFFVLINNLQSRRQFNRIILVIIFTGLLVAILEMTRGFNFPFINKNHFAGYMEMIIPLTIGYLLTDLIKPKKIIFTFIVVIMISALFLCLSRAGTLCFLGSVIFMVCALRLRRGLKRKATIIYILIIISILFLIIMGVEPALERFSTLFKKEIVSAGGRWDIWKDTFKMIIDFPLFGTGLGTFGNIYPAYKTVAAQAIFSYAHSDFLELISETGIVGLGLIVWFLSLFFRGIFLNWLNRHHPFVKGIALGGLTGLLGILLYSFFDFNLHIPANALLFTIIMALTYKCVFVEFNDNENI